MNAVTLVVPSSWRTYKTEIKDSLDFFTLLAEPPFSVSIMGGGEVERVGIKDSKKLNEKQKHTLIRAIDILNDKAGTSYQDPCKAVVEWSQELKETSSKLDRDAFQKYLFNKILSRSAQ